jgi:release factor glutamine methyltransferase
MATVRELLGRAAQLPGDSPRRDAEILLGHSLGRPRSWLYTWPEREVEPDAAARYAALLARRAAGEPVAYLTGSRDFWSLQLAVDRHTLVPRAETELLVEWALQLPLDAQARVLDLGTGSGAIALALAAERPGWQVSAVDASAAALAVARRNARRLGLERVRLVESDWYRALGGERFDLLVSNPPYIAARDPHLQRGDLRFEPAAALVAGADGLEAIRELVAGAPARLGAGGWLLLEHGAGQAAAVRALLRDAGCRDPQTRVDLAGQPRVSGGQFHAD